MRILTTHEAAEVSRDPGSLVDVAAAEIGIVRRRSGHLDWRDIGFHVFLHQHRPFLATVERDTDGSYILVDPCTIETVGGRPMPVGVTHPL